MNTTALAPARPLALARLGMGVAVALAANLVAYAVASAAGATWVANGQKVNALLVGVATIVPMVIGGAITWLLARRWVKGTATMAWVGLVFAVVSVPGPLLGSDDAPTRFALAAMHITTGIVWFFAVHPSRSSRIG